MATNDHEARYLANLAEYQSGAKLWGEEFTDDDIAAWYEDEKEGYAGLGDHSGSSPERYTYRVLNEFHGFSRITLAENASALGLGSAEGYEFLPVINKLASITIVEPSDDLRRPDLKGVPLNYLAPSLRGDIPVPDASIDLVTCFGVLHHVPVVSSVVKELARVLKPTGRALIREPIYSMGDWRQPRKGLTRRERGIPLPLMRQFFRDNGLTIEREGPCMSNLSQRMERIDIKPGVQAWNKPWFVRFDAGLSKASLRFYKYNRTPGNPKVMPMDAFWILKKS